MEETVTIPKALLQNLLENTQELQEFEAHQGNRLRIVNYYQREIDSIKHILKNMEV